MRHPVKPISYDTMVVDVPNYLRTDPAYNGGVVLQYEDLGENESKGRTIVDLFAREDTTLWVLTDRGENHTPDGAMAVLDVFDGAGRFAHQLRVNGLYQPGRDELYIHGNYVAVVVNGGPMGGADLFSGAGEDDLPEEVEVRLYRMSSVD